MFEALEARWLLSTVSPIAALTDSAADVRGPRQVMDLEPGWRFQKSNVSGAEAVSFDDAAWSTVDLPHTWNSQDGQDGGTEDVDTYYRGVGWYRKQLAVPDTLVGKQLFLKFDGASLVSNVYVNGTFVGEHRGGFAAFTFDVTDVLRPGETNVIAVKVDNANKDDVAPLSGDHVTLGGADFTFFGGLYRGVDLIATDPVHVTLTDYASPGVYLKQTNVSRASADVDVITKVLNDGTEGKNVTVVADVLDADGNRVTQLTSTHFVAAGHQVQFSQRTVLHNPHLWNGRLDPYLYEVQVKVMPDGAAEPSDVISQPLGLRYFRTDPQNGFFLNGERYDLNGLNMHQDRLDKGWAVADADLQQDVDLLKEVGATMVRLVHYQHAEHTYDLLDRAGIVTWTEIPYVFDDNASEAFELNIKRQLRELIRQNYNHPSIAFWGLFNALYSDEVANRLVPELRELAYAEDPSRKTIAATANRVEPGAKINHLTDSIGFNDYFGWYRGEHDDFGGWADDFHDSFPSRVLGVAEYGAGGSVRQHEEDPDYVATTPNSRLGWHSEEYQNEFHEAHWAQMAERDWLNYKLVFNIFDFAVDDRDEGDTAGRNDKGLVTYDRATKKDSFYFYKSNWSDEPTVYVSSRRFVDRPDNETYVKIYSNLDSVELKVNGVSLGVKTGNDVNVFTWEDVGLAGGANTIEAVGTRDGQTFTDTVTWNAPGNSPAPAPPPASVGGDGLSATYFDNVDLTGPSISRVDRTVDFDWGLASPDPLIDAETFSARWTGKVVPQFTETYTFTTSSNDGVRLWVDGRLIIDQWVPGRTSEYSGSIELIGGQKHDLVLEYFDNIDKASMKLHWESASRSRQIIPRDRLFTA